MEMRLSYIGYGAAKRWFGRVALCSEQPVHGDVIPEVIRAEKLESWVIVHVIAKTKAHAYERHWQVGRSAGRRRMMVVGIRARQPTNRAPRTI